MNQTFKLRNSPDLRLTNCRAFSGASYAKFREDLDLDSQGIVEFTKTVDKHGVGIPYEAANEINTIWDLVRYIETDNSFGKPTAFDKAKESIIDFIKGSADDNKSGNYTSCLLRLGLATFILAGSILGANYGFTNFGWVGGVIGVVLGYFIGMYIFSALFIVK